MKVHQWKEGGNMCLRNLDLFSFIFDIASNRNPLTEDFLKTRPIYNSVSYSRSDTFCLHLATCVVQTSSIQNSHCIVVK